MQIENQYIQQLTDSLKALNPHLVLLFGSYAYGTPDSGSDIDLLVVTNDNYMPKDYNQHNELYLKISKAIRPVKKHVAVDLIVHTLPMYEEFVKQNSSFGNEIVSKGKILYESNHTTVA